jgi:4-amino-4-deoxy-L-arabinose transferase-like glycosyltransferase
MALTAFTFAAVALVTAALLSAAALRLHGCSFAIGAYVLAWVGVVGLGEVLSLLDAVGRIGYVVGTALLLVAAVCSWHLRGRPFPALPRPRRAAFRAHPQLAVLAVIVFAAVGYQAFLVMATPPNNYDSLTYHLPRVVAWLQQGHAGYFDAGTARANAFPPNAELGILYTVALLGRDTLAALPQLLAELAVLACVYGIGRRLGFTRPAAVFAALLTATLSEVALQAVTTQNDLVVAAFVAAAVYFVIGGERRELPLAALAAALAIGTKLTGLLALPLMVVAALLLLPRRRLAELAVWGVLAFVGFGAFWYVLNTVQTHHPLGIVPEADPYRPHVTAGGTASTFARIYWRFVDFSGLQPPSRLLNGLSHTASEAFAVAHIAPNPPEATATHFSFWPSTLVSEDSSYFGVLGFLLIIPASAGFALAWLFRRASRARGVIAAALPLFVVVIALTQAYNDWLGRFMLIPIAVAMPLTAWLYDRRLRLFTMLAVILGAATLFGTHVNNIAKPVGLDGDSPVWAMPRLDAESLHAGRLGNVLPLVNRTVPRDAKLGVVLGTNDPSYLFYGLSLGRHLVELPAGGAERLAEAQGVRWIAVSPDADRPVRPTRWRVQTVRGGWQLLTSPLTAAGGTAQLASRPAARGAGPGQDDPQRSWAAAMRGGKITGWHGPGVRTSCTRRSGPSRAASPGC